MTRSAPATGPSRRRRSGRGTVIAAAAVTVSLAAVTVFLVGRFCWGTGTSGAAEAPDPSTAMPRVQQYLTALHDNDKDAVRRMSPPGYVEVDEDIDTRLHAYAGV